ncbi:PREDICTED: probable cytochrome P450 303a1 [Ceratosolen solmsi marchali]|uniref:Probable cytochrome P450 303a1 n=1 Tax=Ceratosolen solmsi marchali TaxID=326594 RepID=A0AAJ6VM09_9HYME|nr:PREDICTED: probable cytochrome P450 303a1 [Ceratosolen solmsi marchali]
MLDMIIYIFLVVLVIYCYSCIKPKNFPPGPKWYPFIGCFPQYYVLRKKLGYIHLAFEKLSENYGPILGLKLGTQKIVIISSYDLVKKVLMLEDFNGRPNSFFFKLRSLGRKRGILFSDGSNWMQNRRFTMRHLKTFGFSYKVMSQQLDIESQGLIEFLSQQSKAGPVSMQKAFDVAVLNMLWTTFAGHRFEYNDKKCKELLWIVHEVFRVNDMLGGLMSHLPFLRFFIPKLLGYNDLVTMLDRLWSFFNDEIDNHMANLPQDDPRDLIDRYLMEIKKGTNEEATKEEINFDRENLLVLCLDLFLAGSKTTSDTLAWIIAYIALNPQWQKELQDELNKVVGRDRSPTLADMKNLPFIEAFIAEIQRYLELAPLGLPHRAMKDISLNGYLIPEDTVILLNFRTAHNDKSYWKNPEEFDPQRFLNDQGKFQQNNAFIPFGLGKRRCLGENLARSTLFVYFTNILHHFDFEIDEKYAKPDINGFDGFVVSPKPFYLKLTKRTQ